MPPPKVFISYSHRDKKWKDHLVRQLRVLQLEGALEVWNDRRIAAGDGWRSEIESAMEMARVAVLLVSADFLTSDFIRGTEVPRLLERQAKDGLRIIPLIVRPCPWRRVPWLEKIHCRPADGRALAEGTSVRIEKDLSALAEEIADLLPDGDPPVSARSIEPGRPEGDPSAAFKELEDLAAILKTIAGQVESLFMRLELASQAEYLSKRPLEANRSTLLRSARELSDHLQEIEARIIPAQRTMLKNLLEDLSRKYRLVTPQLDEAERESERLLQDLAGMSVQLSAQVRLEVRQLLYRLAQEVPRWVNETEIEGKLRLLAAKHTQQIYEFVEEVARKVSARMEAEIQRWERRTLWPLLENWQNEAEAVIGKRSQDLCAKLEEVPGELYSVKTPAPVQIDAILKGVSRLKAIEYRSAVGLIPGASLVAPVAISELLARARWDSGSFARELKRSIGTKLQESFEKNVDPMAKAIVYEVDREIHGFLAGADRSLNAYLDGIRTQVEAVLRDQRSGAVQVQERQRQLEEIAAEATEAEDTLRQVIFRIAGP